MSKHIILQVSAKKANTNGFSVITDAKTDGLDFYEEVQTLDRANEIVKCWNAHDRLRADIEHYKTHYERAKEFHAGYSDMLISTLNLSKSEQVNMCAFAGKYMIASKIKKIVAERDNLVAALERVKTRIDNGGRISERTDGLYNCIKKALEAAKESSHE